MNDLAQFPITKRWPAQHPERIQLYSLPTPNGVKVSIALEELGLPYEAHLVSFSSDDQMTPEFLSLNPNNKIPAIIDPDGPGGKPLGLFETGAILIYLADKTGRLIPEDPAQRFHCLQWLMFQMGGVGPMFGQFGHFYKFAADKVKDPYAQNRYADETKRLLAVMDKHLEGKNYFLGDQYTIADIAIFPWVATLDVFYEAGDFLKMSSYTNVMAHLERCLAKPASQRGREIPPRE